MNASERDERLRELLRAADPARGAAELGESEVAWMRQRVLAAASEPRARRRAAGAWMLAGAAALLAIALGLVPRRADLPGAAAPPRVSAQADTTPARRSSPAAQVAAAPGTTRSSRAGTVVATPTPAPPRRSRPTARRPRPVPVEPAAREAVVAHAGGERQPYQLQLTAPGGTRIVWVLTADNGR